MPARFVVKKGPTGKFRVSLHAENGEIVATSEAYNSRASALKGIAAPVVATLTPLFDKVMAIPGVSEVLKPTIDGLKSKITTLVG